MTIEVSNEPEDFADFEHQGWQEVSAGYEHHFVPLTRQTVAPLLDAARVTSGTTMLDVCTGPGLIAATAAKRGAISTGLDFSAEFLRIARRNHPEVDFREGDAQALPFDANCFDAAVCGYGIIHVPDPATVISEMHRVLKPGARLAVSVWQAPAAGNGFGLFIDAIKAYADLSVPLPHGPDFFQFSADGKLAAALETCGLSDVEVSRVDQTWDLDAPMTLVECFMEGGVRTRGQLLAQTQSVRQQVFSKVTAGMEQYKSSGGRYLVPMPALIGSGIK
jgi:SAM-dependent methyltransferase